MSKVRDLLDNLEPEEVMIELGCDYRIQTGRSGDQINIKECPRCNGNKWKVFLNAETGLGNCFHGSCVGEPGFNIYTFSKHVLGTPKETMEMLERLGGKSGWRPKKKVSRRQVTNTETTIDVSLLPKSIALPYKGFVGKYLDGRGFWPETVETLNWRYSVDGNFEYLFDNEVKYQDYSKRIIIPILNLNGELVTFQGRDVTGEAEKKYLFPPGLPGTSLYLYNGNNAVGKERIVINEGALDVAAVIQAFSEDSLLSDVIPVGTFGKVLSHGRENGEDQLGALLTLKEHGLKEITMMWDSEVKTLQQAATTAGMLNGYGFKTSVAILPPDCDPNEATPGQVRKAFREATPISSKMALLKFLSR